LRFVLTDRVYHIRYTWKALLCRGCDAKGMRHHSDPTALHSYSHVQPPQIRATLVRLYMLTNMTLSAATPASRRNETAAPTVLIYGSAIKTPANSPGFSNMQFSNRRQTGGLTIASPVSPGRSAASDHFRSSLVTHQLPPLSNLAFPRAECYFVCASRTRQAPSRTPK